MASTEWHAERAHQHWNQGNTRRALRHARHAFGSTADGTECKQKMDELTKQLAAKDETWSETLRRNEVRYKEELAEASKANTKWVKCPDKDKGCTVS
jgi:hypothetical protein